MIFFYNICVYICKRYLKLKLKILRLFKSKYNELVLLKNKYSELETCLIERLTWIQKKKPFTIKPVSQWVLLNLNQILCSLPNIQSNTCTMKVCNLKSNYWKSFFFIYRETMDVPDLYRVWIFSIIRPWGCATIWKFL